MSDLDYVQRSFNVGEISPDVYARMDLEGKYPHAVKTLKNFISMAHGPAVRRMGTEFIAEAKNHDKKCRLVPFEFNTDQAYILEYGDLYIRYFMDGGVIGAPYETVSTYTEAMLPDLDFTQMNDTMYIAHQEVAQRTLVRSGHASWALSDIDFIEGPFLPKNLTTTTLTPSATTGSITITASAVTGINDDQGFLDGDVGRLIGIDYGGNWGVAEITAVTSTILVSATVVVDFNNNTAKTHWKLGAWSEYTGYPKTVTFDNDRLCWACSPTQPQSIWLSKVGIYIDHGISSPLVDDDALDLTVNTTKANAIQWIESARKFAIGTTGAEFWLTSATGDGPITALSKQRSPGSFYGCQDIKPVSVGGTIIFVRRHGKALQELAYNWEEDAFTGEDLTLLARHLTRTDPIIDMTFQREPFRVLWCVLESGRLISLTYYREHKVYGWAQHDTDGLFESVACIPGENENEVWFVVKRTIGGSTKRYIERMAESFKPDVHEDTTDAFYVDSGLTYDERQTVESISYANPGVFTLTSHGYSDGDSITVRAQYPDSYYKKVDGRWTCTVDEDENLNRERYEVYSSTANTFQVKDEDGNVVDLSSHVEADVVTVGENISTVTGLSHLEGKEVSILADGEDVSGKTVTSGSITLGRSASVIHVGLSYTSDIETLPPTIFTQQGSLQGALMQYKNLVLQIHESLGFSYGLDQDSLVPYEFADDSVPSGLPAPLFSGFTDEISFEGEDTREATMLIRQDQPLPLTVMAILSQVEIGG